MPATSRPSVLLCALGLSVTPLPSFAQDAPSEESSTEAAAEMGTLRVGANRPGAKVWVDNKEVGVAPLVRQVPIGEHHVRVAADNFNPFVSRVQVQPGQTAAVSAQLFPGGGTVEFASNANGGTVTIDGNKAMPMPIRLSTVQPGKYRYTLDAIGYESEEGQFEFARGSNLYIYAELEPSAGLFIVDTVPSPSVIRLDGTDIGAGPIRRDDLPPGPHLVEVEVPGHARVVQAVDTSDGSKLQVTGRVPKRGGTTRVKTHQGDAVVKMSGVTMANGRSFALENVARGRYAVEVAAPGYRTATGRIAVDEGRRIAYRIDWAKEGDRARSQLVEMPAWYARWTTWTIAGSTVAVGVTSAVLIARARRPDAIPPADITVTLP